MRSRCLRPFSALALLVAAGACGEFPQLDGETDRTAPYPDLVPVENLRAGIPEQRIDDPADSRIESRIAALQARAARLRGRVIDNESRARLQGGVRNR